MKQTTKDNNIVKRTLDLKKKPILTAEQKARLNTVATMPDEQIDYQDAPYLPNAVWSKPAPETPQVIEEKTEDVGASIARPFCRISRAPNGRPYSPPGDDDAILRYASGRKWKYHQ